MSSAIEKIQPSDSPHTLFVWLLKRYRERANLTQSQLAERAAYSPSLVTQVENMQRMPTLEFAERCDELLSADGVLVNLWPLINRMRFPEWFKTFAELEATAIRRRSFESLYVPGLFQTEAYVRVLVTERGGPFNPEEEIEQLVAFRLARHRLLTQPNPALQWAVLDESVLRRCIGGRDVMRGQIQHLIDLAQLPHVDIQVLPLSSRQYAGMDGSTTIFTYERCRELVYADVLDFSYVLSDPEKVAQYAYRFDRVRAQSLPPDASLELMSSVLEET
jgi:transcriptional regulator with XRE-family HTH domain